MIIVNRAMFIEANNICLINDTFKISVIEKQIAKDKYITNLQIFIF